MNLKKKSDMQERRINALQKQIDNLTKENESLRIENKELLDKDSRHQEQLAMIDEIRREYADSIAELKNIKEQYQQAVYDARQLKKDYAKKFKPLLKQLKSQVYSKDDFIVVQVVDYTIDATSYSDDKTVDNGADDTGDSEVTE